MAVEKEITQINVDLSCDLQCDKCEKFYDCDRPEKQDMYRQGVLIKRGESLYAITESGFQNSMEMIGPLQ